MKFLEIFQPLLRFLAGNHRRRSLGPFRSGGPNPPPPLDREPEPPPAPLRPQCQTRVGVNWNRGPNE